MKLLFLGDVMGRAGRAAIVERLPGLRAEWGLDFVVVNGENASSGAGLTGEHAKLLLKAGVDCLTLGDHAFDQKDMLAFIEQENRIIRPLNFAKLAPGRGARLFSDARGRKVLVCQVLGQVFMKRPFDDPFSAIDAALKTHPLGGLAQAIVVDMHCEATSEKMAMGHWCDGRASLVVGTHTHVPTGDAQILRAQLAATANGLSMQPISQALQEYPEQARTYADIHNLLEAPAPRFTVQMWARLGHAPVIEPSPRRGLDAHILKT